MKTSHTIPWEAVVQGCPPSRAKRLPLVVSRSCAHLNQSLFAHLLAAPLAGRVQPADSDNPMAMVSRANSSTLLELPLPEQGATAILTSDGLTSVNLQAYWNPLNTWLSEPAYRRDAFARTYVARYARLDPDARAFVPADSTEEDQPNTSPRFEFLHPESWGFTRMSTSMHWTAHNLFHSPTPIKNPPKDSTATRPRFKDPFEEPIPDRGDPFQCIPQLRQFKRPCEQATARVRSYGLALCLGRCRLFGVKLNDADDFSLAAAPFEQCSTYLIDRLKDACRRLIELQTTASAHSVYLHRNFALEILEIRMDAHSACLALDEAYAAAQYESHPQADKMGRRLNQVRRVINLFDGNLQKQLPLLSLAASTFLLENWRRLLAPAHRKLPPWWLDGCLEEVAWAARP